jgi:hypothetical protein
MQESYHRVSPVHQQNGWTSPNRQPRIRLVWDLAGAASITLQHGISTIAMIGHLPLNLTTRHEKISWYQAFVVHIAHAR